MGFRASKYLENEGISIARGHVVNTEIRNIFGRIPPGAIATAKTQFTTVWEEGTEYEYPSSAVQLDIQTAATDTASIKIVGLDESYNEIEEIVALNGIILTDQTKAQSILRVNEVLTIAGNATGDVTLVQTGTSDVVAKIEAGTGRNQAAIYTVPAGCEFYLSRINCFGAETGGAAGTEKTHFFRNYVQLPTGVILRVAELAFHNSFDIYRTNPFKYSEKTDLQLQMKTTATTPELSVFAEGILIKG